MSVCFQCLSAFLIINFVSVASIDQAKILGLTVDENGLIIKDGVPYRGIGVNYFDAFSRTLHDPDDTSYREGFAELARLSIPFVRMMGCGFWPKNWELYFEDKTRYFELLDDVVRSAEENEIGLLISLFWYSAVVPDLVGEPRNQWGNPKSKTIEFMRTYVHEVVTRYNDSPAIWGWEFGNEYNLAADLPNAAEHRPQVVPSLGTATSRSVRDDLTHDMIGTAFVEFAKEVRKYDQHRIISTGNSLPRASAWHQWKEKSWTQDTQGQYAERLWLDNPDPVDTFSIHVYEDTMKRFGRQVSLKEFLDLTMEIAAKDKKPLFVGEFGAEQKRTSGTFVLPRFNQILSAIESAKVPLAALWVYDFEHQADTWNVTSTNQRAYQLKAIASANRRVQRNFRKD